MLTGALALRTGALRLSAAASYAGSLAVSEKTSSRQIGEQARLLMLPVKKSCVANSPRSTTVTTQDKAAFLEPLTLGHCSVPPCRALGPVD